jgi:uncharacterized protein YodC (DUF2158 family)
MAAEAQFPIAMKVKHKLGGATGTMFVIDHEDDHVICRWFDGKRWQRSAFLPIELEEHTGIAGFTTYAKRRSPPA